MKKLINAFSLLGLIMLLSITACKDEGIVPESPVPTSFTKKVVVEKFTGEWCGACPASSKWMDNMSAQNGNKFIAIAVHAGSQSDRYKDNPACQTMYNFLVSHLRHAGLSSIGFPNVMLDRDMNAANKQVINGYSGDAAMTAKVKEELAEPAKCGLAIVSSFVGEKLHVTVKYQLKEALGANHAVTVYVTENGLDGSKQVSASSGFMHKHTLRGLLTPKEGKSIDGSITGQTFELVMDPFDCTGFVKGNLEVVAFINHNGADYSNREILNGQSVHAGSTQNFD